MDSIISKFLEKHDKTNLHALLCLKRVYIDNKRDITQPFILREMQKIWREVKQVNPSFLDADYAPVFFSKQKFITKIEDKFYIDRNFQDEFRQINWDSILNEIALIQPLFSGLYQICLNNPQGFAGYCLTILSEDGKKHTTNKKLIPALLEIMAYCILKVKLNFYGADIFRWTRTNANDGGVDMTCGDVSYSVTTNLNKSKITKDAAKQVRSKLNFITLTNNLGNKQIKVIADQFRLTINVITLADLEHIYAGFSPLQREELLKMLRNEMEKELDIS